MIVSLVAFASCAAWNATSIRSILSERPRACGDVLAYCLDQLQVSDESNCESRSSSTVICDWPEWECEFTLYSSNRIDIECRNSEWSCVSELTPQECRGQCSERGLSGWAIAGITIAFFVVLAIAGCVIRLLLMRRRQLRNERPLEQLDDPLPEAAAPTPFRPGVPPPFVPPPQPIIPDAPTPYGAAPFICDPVYGSTAAPAGVPMAYPHYPRDDDDVEAHPDQSPYHYAYPTPYNPA
jgi:hypothetical protein